MQSKIVVCLLVGLLVFHPNCGSDAIDDYESIYDDVIDWAEETTATTTLEPVTETSTPDDEEVKSIKTVIVNKNAAADSSEEDLDDGVAWEEFDVPLETTSTAPQAAAAEDEDDDIDADQDKGEEKEDEVIVETSTVAEDENEIDLMPDEQQEEQEDENNDEQNQTTEATTTSVPDEVDDSQEEQTTTPELEDELGANIQLIDENEGSEDWTEPEEEASDTTPKRDAVDSSTNEVDLVLDQVEQWQSELNQSIATVSSHIADLIAEELRIQKSLKAAMPTSESSENELLTPQFKRFLIVHYQLVFLTQQQSLLKRSLEQMKRCSALMSSFVQRCQTMPDDLSNSADFRSIVEKLKVSLPVLRQYPTSTDAIVENERMLNELNADVLRFIA